MHGRLKLLVVQRFGPSVQVKVKVRARDRKWILFLLSLSVLKSDEHALLSCPPGLA